MFQNNRKGFSLVELLVVMAIIGVLFSVALPAYRSYVVRSKISTVVIKLSDDLMLDFNRLALRSENNFPETYSISEDIKYVSSSSYTSTDSSATVELDLDSSELGLDGYNAIRMEFSKESASAPITFSCEAQGELDESMLPNICKDD